jgi:rod shape-determining protein MreD
MSMSWCGSPRHERRGPPGAGQAGHGQAGHGQAGRGPAGRGPAGRGPTGGGREGAQVRTPEPGPLTTADVARLSLVVFVVLAVQDTVLDAVRVGGAHPDAVLLVAAAAGYVAGPERGAAMGFVTGLAADLLLPTTFGLTALVGCLLGFAAGTATSGLVRTSLWLGVLTMTAGCVAGLVGYAVLAALLGQPGTVSDELAPALVVATPAAAVLSVPVLAVVRWALPPAASPAASAPPGALRR